MRISGFSSGLDIDQIVQDLMKAKRAPMDRLTQQRTTLEWQREQYREINIKLVDFRNNKLFNYGLEGSISAKKVNITGNTTAVSAKTPSGAISGTMTVEVATLATAANLKSTLGIGAVDTSKTLSQLNGTSINYIPDGDGNVNFTIANGAYSDTITVSESATLASVITAINGSDAKVTAFLDSASGKMSLTSKSTGNGSITVPTDNEGFLANFDLTDSTAGVDTLGLKINGIATSQSSNTFTVNGIEITLNAPTGGTASTLNVVTDTDKVVDTIKSFINDYNDVLNSVNKKLNEERYRKYPPLTADQKKEMKESEISLWEEKAKSGLLRRDSTLSKMTNDIRLASLTSVTVNAQQVNMADLGLATGKWYDRGKLVIEDESKLRAAIEADPDQVVKFFTQQTTQADPVLKKSPTNPDNGLFNRLSNVIMSALDEVAKKAGTSKYSTDKDAEFLPSSYIGDQMRTIDLKINDMDRRLYLLENSYYKQFSAMETAMNRYSAQSSSLFGASQ